MNPVSSSTVSTALSQAAAVHTAAAPTPAQSADKAQTQPKSGAEAVAKVVATPYKAEVNLSEHTQPMKDSVERAAKQIQEFVKEMGRNLSFRVDETTGYYLVRVINPETNEVIRQLPSEEAVRIAKNLEHFQSVLVDQKA